MVHPFTASPTALACVFLLTCLAAAEQPRPQACDPGGVCTAAQPAAGQAVAAGPKQMWASSRLFTDAPPLEVGKWLTDKPDLDGKFLVIEFWRTWCGACKRMTPFLNNLQAKHGDELAVIALTCEAEEAVQAYKGPKLEYFLALDLPQTNRTAAATPERKSAEKPVANGPDQAADASADRSRQGRYEALFDVWGWPHVIILEPQYRTVIWEGFPGLKGYELTEAKIEKILAIGRAAKQETKNKK